MFKAVLFDLDGTLLPMNQDEFVRYYFSLLAERFQPLGYETKEFHGAIWKGIAAEVANDGSRTNEEVFWDVFASVFGERSREDAAVFDDFYRNEFQKVKGVCHPSPLADEIVKMLRSKGCKVVLATNPIFPKVATESRVRWAGLDVDDFEICTTMENSCLAKPNLDYYRHLLEQIDVRPEDCLMVGNDVEEDMVASELGMKVFLITYDVISRTEKDLSVYPQGDLKALKEYLEREMCQ